MRIAFDFKPLRLTETSEEKHNDLMASRTWQSTLYFCIISQSVSLLDPVLRFFEVDETRPYLLQESKSFFTTEFLCYVYIVDDAQSLVMKHLMA